MATRLAPMEGIEKPLIFFAPSYYSTIKKAAYCGIHTCRALLSIRFIVANFFGVEDFNTSPAGNRTPVSRVTGGILTTILPRISCLLDLDTKHPVVKHHFFIPHYLKGVCYDYVQSQN